MKTKKSKADQKVFGPDYVPCVADDLLAKVNPDGSVAIMKYDENSFFFTLDLISAEFWQLIDGKRTLQNIKDELIVRHDPPISRFNKDVNALLSQLLEHNLIK